MKESYIKLPNITVSKLQDVVNFLDNNDIEYIEEYKANEEIDRLNNIIKEVRKYIKEHYYEQINYGKYVVESDKILKILDKENNNE